MLKKIIVSGLFTVSVLHNTMAQTVSLQAIKDKMYAVNKNFDSADYITFDVEIQYSSDTVLGRYESDYQLAKYALHGKNIYLDVGGTEFLRNDSFAITAYNDEKVLMVNRQRAQPASAYFPMKEFVDSTLSYYGSYYTITDDTTAAEETISFVTDSADMPCKKMAVSFDREYKLPNVITSSFMQPLHDEDVQNIPSDSLADSTGNLIAPLPLINKYIKMNFRNYSFVENLQAFDHNRFIFYDRFRKEYTAVGKYAGYKVYASGLPNTGKEYNDIELPAGTPSAVPAP